MPGTRLALAFAAVALAATTPLLPLRPRAIAAQVQVRVGDPHRADYSELHDALRSGTPAADSVEQIMSIRGPAPLWRIARQALTGKRSWNDGLLALTRLAELPPSAYADSATKLAAKIEAGGVKSPPATDASDLLDPLRAIVLHRRRAKEGDAKVRDEILAAVPGGKYGIAEAWTLGQMPGIADTLAARFLAAKTPEERVRWLTLLGFSTDTTQIPLLARVYASPDSFGIPLRYGMRASDALVWIGTPAAIKALADARAAAKARGAYADPSLLRNDRDFLANDSASVVSRTGRSVEEWLAKFGSAGE
jgi:hypothetical protein